MKFMMLIKSDKASEAGIMPAEADLVAMGKYNEELIKAGVLLTAEGLQPSSKGVRVRHAGGKATVIDGPFAETKELIAGFWMIQVKSLAEATEWAKRVPFDPKAAPSEIELRQVFEASDFTSDLYPSDEAQELMKKEGEFRKRTNT